jgi:catechol 2,3-dioxygenase-like lactoylglutathione lyase family enzyme
MAKAAAAVTPLKRTAIFVRNLRRSLDFYQGVLGMNIWVQGKAGSELPAIFKLLGMRPGLLRWVILQSEDVAWGMVGLFEVSKAGIGATRLSQPARANAGEACLVFHTPDIRKVHRGARRLKLKVLCPPTTLALAQHGVESREMTLRDPNGVMVNFIQNMKGDSIGLSNRFPGIKGAVRKRRTI